MEPDHNQRRQYLYTGEIAEPSVRQDIHSQKRILIMAMDFSGIVFWELQSEKSTVDGLAYKNFLERHVDQWLVM